MILDPWYQGFGEAWGGYPDEAQRAQSGFGGGRIVTLSLKLFNRFKLFNVRKVLLPAGEFF